MTETYLPDILNPEYLNELQKQVPFIDYINLCLSDDEIYNNCLLQKQYTKHYPYINLSVYLASAIKKGSVKEVNLALALGANPNTIDGITPVTVLAIELNNINIVI